MVSRAARISGPGRWTSRSRRRAGASFILLLIIGLAITFYLPRRRIWARIAPSGELRLVARSDRYVDLEREFGRLLDDLVARRKPPEGSSPPQSA